MDKKVVIITHNGSFHGDDVFAVATLLILLKSKLVEVRVIRSRDPKVINEGDFVVDVGGIYDEKSNKFDHHQIGGAGFRPNKVPFASFGLVWKKYGAEICGSEKIATEIDTRLVQPIDYIDNQGLSLKEIFPGVYPYTIDRIVEIFVSLYSEKGRDNDEIFFHLVSFAKEIIEREIENVKAVESSRSIVDEAYHRAPDKRIIILEKNYPWEEIILQYPEPLFVVYPDEKNKQWEISAVRKGLYQYESRKKFVAEWGGKRNEELVAISGISDAVFCHNGLFFAVAKSKEGAVALAQAALMS